VEQLNSLDRLGVFVALLFIPLYMLKLEQVFWCITYPFILGVCD